MNRYEFSRHFGIGLSKVDAMNREGEIKLDPVDSKLAPMQHCLNRQKVLTAEHLATLIEQPELLDQLERHVDKVRAQLAELGNVEPAPQKIGWAIDGAARNGGLDVDFILRWAMKVLPAHEVSHHWLAVRLLLSVPESSRAAIAPRMRRVMLNLRKRAEFVDWWRVEGEGSKRVTWYSRPKGFDL